jgi:hypothetical protein
VAALQSRIRRVVCRESVGCLLSLTRSDELSDHRRAPPPGSAAGAVGEHRDRLLDVVCASIEFAAAVAVISAVTGAAELAGVDQVARSSSSPARRLAVRSPPPSTRRRERQQLAARLQARRARRPHGRYGQRRRHAQRDLD